jgi:hypothetical protein
METIMPGLLEIVQLAKRCSLLFVEEIWHWLNMTYPTVNKALQFSLASSPGHAKGLP